MAGIEKVCEFSGDYPGYEMYGYKRNSIQIMPEYRKLFRGKEAILHIAPGDWRWWRKAWNSSSYIGKEENIYDNIDFYEWEKNGKPYTPTKKEFLQFQKNRGYTLTRGYYYALQVFDEDLFGEVGGLYVNYTTYLPTVKRKIKRLLRCKDLDIKWHESYKNIYNLR